jgi:hypothetical protein
MENWTLAIPIKGCTSLTPNNQKLPVKRSSVFERLSGSPDHETKLRRGIDGHSAAVTAFEVQKVVIDNLLVKDVYKFGEYTEIDGIAACQTVNSVRADGQDTGDMQGFAMKKDGAWHFLRFLDSTHEECVQAAKEVTTELVAKGYKG